MSLVPASPSLREMTHRGPADDRTPDALAAVNHRPYALLTQIHAAAAAVGEGVAGR